jgi:hypothetical protein
MRIELGYLDFMATARKLAPHFLQALSMVGPLWICYFVRLCRLNTLPKILKDLWLSISSTANNYLTSALLNLY